MEEVEKEEMGRGDGRKGSGVAKGGEEGGRRGSTGMMGEMWKRKREKEEEIGFMKSRRTVRSPVKGEEAGREMESLFEGMRKEIRGGFKEVKEEIEGLKKEMRRREEIWEKEKQEMRDRIESLERKWEEIEERGGEGEMIKRIEERVKKVEEEKERESRKKSEERKGEMEERVKVLEKREEERERDKRRRNIVMRGVEIGKGEAREEVEKILKEIGMKEGIGKIRRIKIGKGDEREIVVVELNSEEEKSRIMEGKRKLKGSKVWIEDDLTYEERRARWIMRRIAEEEEGKGSRVWRGYGKVRINEEWWRWDEEVRGVVNRKGEKKVLTVEGDERREEGREKENRKEEN